MKVSRSTNRYSFICHFFYPYFFSFFCCDSQFVCNGLSHCDRHIDDQLYFKWKMHRIQKGKWKIEWTEIRFGIIAIALQWMKQYARNFYHCWEWSTLCNAIKMDQYKWLSSLTTIESTKILKGMKALFDCRMSQNKSHSSMIVHLVALKYENKATSGCSFYYDSHTQFVFTLLKSDFDINKQTR